MSELPSVTVDDFLVAGRQAGWSHSHKPQTTSDLVMHKKKIQEISGWLELQKEPGLRCSAPRMLVLSGTPFLLLTRCFLTIELEA